MKSKVASHMPCSLNGTVMSCHIGRTYFSACQLHNVFLMYMASLNCLKCRWAAFSILSLCCLSSSVISNIFIWLKWSSQSNGTNSVASLRLACRYMLLSKWGRPAWNPSSTYPFLIFTCLKFDMILDRSSYLSSAMSRLLMSQMNLSSWLAYSL